MSSYIVSARKYRPQTFDSVVGQHALTTTLKNAIAAGRLAHAFLFCGPRGVGKTTCARIFSRTINCLSPTPEGEACGECECCRAFAEGRSYNIHELDAASNNSVDDIRALIEQVQIPPAIGRYKVFIVDEVHMLSQQAFNAFLKTLEEPPAHAIFILATTEKHKILPTILSRCQIYDFARVEVPDIVNHLRSVAQKEGIQAEDEALALIARKADGGMRDALSLFDKVAGFSQGNITLERTVEDLGVLSTDYYFALTDALLKGDVSTCLLTLSEILAKGFEPSGVIQGLAVHFRDLLVSRDAATLPLLETAQSTRQRYGEQATRCTPRFLYRGLRLCGACDINYRASHNKRLLAELTLIEIAQGDDDDAGCGLRPTKYKTLKPLFASAAAQQSSAAPAAPHAAPTTAATPATEHAAAPIASAPAERTTPFRAATPSRPQRARTLSIRQAATEATPAHEATQPAPQDAPAQGTTQLATPFDEAALRLSWTRFAMALPREQSAMAGRMRGMEPSLTDAHTVSVAVENPQVKSYMEALAPQLTAHLRKELRNDLITLTFPLAEADAPRRAFSRREQYAAMLEKSAPLSLLARTLKLELV